MVGFRVGVWLTRVNIIRAELGSSGDGSSYGCGLISQCQSRDMVGVQLVSVVRTMAGL